MMAGQRQLSLTGCAITTTSCTPFPGPVGPFPGPVGPFPGPVGPWFYGPDTELDRLRQLERQAAQEREKEEIRQRLRRMGVPEDQIAGPRFPGFPTTPLPHVAFPRTPTLDEVIRQVPKFSQPLPKKSGKH